MTIAVCIKWVNYSGPVESDTPDERFAGFSFADQAALEWALRIAENSSDEVLVLTAGPVGAEAVLRDALSRGAHRSVRVDIDLTSDSSVIARSLVGAMSQPRMVWCGDYSNDRGSGSVPSFIAAELNIDQALGLVALELPENANASFAAVRRLDGGRREQLLISGPAVLSVEGSTIRLRRASLKNTMSASKQEIQVITATGDRVETPALRPYRPRPRVTLAPIGLTALERVKHITDTSSGKGHGETVHAEPSAAATLILESLRKWGYLP